MSMTTTMKELAPGVFTPYSTKAITVPNAPPVKGPIYGITFNTPARKDTAIASERLTPPIKCNASEFIVVISIVSRVIPMK
ncbi:hypothetical protein DSECCO2_643970 [anaerobic digester metagenome]